MGKSTEPCRVAECRSGEWIRLETGWWRLGQPLAGGIGARPRLGSEGPWLENLDQSFPRILDLDELVLERSLAQDAASKSLKISARAR